MKIVQFLCSEGQGGLEKHVAELSNGLASRHEVVLLGPRDQEARLEKRVRLVPFDPKGWRYNPLFLLKILRLLRRENADIVHAQGNKAASVLARLRPFLKAKTVGTVHGLKKKVGAFEKLDAAIAVSRGATAPFRNPQKVFVIGNGVALPAGGNDAGKSAALRAAFAPKGDRPVILAVGRLAPVKGFDVLVEAMEPLEADLWIVGEGEERARLSRLISEKRLTGRVTLLGERHDVPSLMGAADLVAISSHREGFSYVMAEALLCRKPIVATKVPGVEDWVLPACLVPPGQAEALSERMRSFFHEKEALLPLWEPIWDKAQRELSVEAMVNRTEAVYFSLLPS